jgi:hypothetical protein
MMTKPAAGTAMLMALPFRASTAVSDPCWFWSVE